MISLLLPLSFEERAIPNEPFELVHPPLQLSVCRLVSYDCADFLHALYELSRKTDADRLLPSNLNGGGRGLVQS